MSVFRHMLRCLYLFFGIIFLSACVHTGVGDEVPEPSDGVTAAKIGNIESEAVTEMAVVVDVQEHTGERNIEIVEYSNPQELNSIEVAAGKGKTLQSRN